MPDLEDLLSDAWRDRTDVVAGDGRVDLAGLTVRVRRRRARRHALQATVSLPVVAALALGAWTLAGRTAQVPPATQSPAPSPTSTTAPSPTDVAPTPLLPAEAGLPPLHELPAGMLEQAGPGWVLSLYWPVPEDVGSDGTPPATYVVALASPEGLAYEVTRFDLPDPTLAPLLSGSIGRWVPGTTTAAITFSGDDFYFEHYDLDLLTGTLSPDDSGPAPDSMLVGYVGDEPIWIDPGLRSMTIGERSVPLPAHAPAEAHVSPDGRAVELGGVVVDVATMTVIGTLDGDGQGGWCTPKAWWTADSLLAFCADRDPWGDPDQYPAGQVDTRAALHPRLVSVDLADLGTGRSTVVRELAAADPWPADVVRVGDREAAFIESPLVVGPEGSLEVEVGAYLLRGAQLDAPGVAGPDGERGLAYRGRCREGRGPVRGAHVRPGSPLMARERRELRRLNPVADDSPRRCRCPARATGVPSRCGRGYSPAERPEGMRTTVVGRAGGAPPPSGPPRPTQPRRAAGS